MIHTTIYMDPVTRKEEEGKAEIVKVITPGELEYDQDGNPYRLDRCQVRFVGEDMTFSRFWRRDLAPENVR